MSDRHHHAPDYLAAIHHLAWLPWQDAHDAGEEPHPLLVSIACSTDPDVDDNPRPYLRSVLDLLDLAESDGADAFAMEIARRAVTHAMGETCEGCDAQAVTSDVEDVPLCGECFEALPFADEEDPEDWQDEDWTGHPDMDPEPGSLAAYRQGCMDCGVCDSCIERSRAHEEDPDAP